MCESFHKPRTESVPLPADREFQSSSIQITVTDRSRRKVRCVYVKLYVQVGLNYTGCIDSGQHSEYGTCIHLDTQIPVLKTEFEILTNKF
jgi:hypothetical protein